MSRQRGSIRLLEKRDRQGRFQYEIRVRMRPGARPTTFMFHAAGKKQSPADAQAEAFLQAKLREVDEGSATTPSRMTLAEWWAAYIKMHRTTKSAAWLRWNEQVARHWSRHLGEIKMQALTVLDVAGARDALLDDGLAPKTVATDLGYLRTALKAAVKLRYLTRNVALDVDPPIVERKPIVPLTADEADVLLAALWATDTTYTNMLACGLLLGVRTYSELGGMRRSDLDLDRHTLRLEQVLLREGLHPAGNQKHRRRLLEIPARAMPFIERQAAWVDARHPKPIRGQAADYLLFETQYGQPVNQRTLHKAFKDALEDAELPATVRIHDLRHTVASLLLQAGANIRVVQAALGHSRVQMTLDTYSHLLPGAVGGALDSVWSKAQRQEEAVGR